MVAVVVCGLMLSQSGPHTDAEVGAGTGALPDRRHVPPQRLAVRLIGASELVHSVMEHEGGQQLPGRSGQASPSPGR